VNASIARLGSAAGWVSLIGIFGYHIGLTIVAGQRVSGTTDIAAIAAYYREPIIAMASVEQFIVAAIMLVFVFALRETCASASPRARLLATLALLFAAVEIPVILTEISVQAALVAVAGRGGDVLGLFRLWDVLYNSGAYVLEAGWVLCFGLAVRDLAAFPRWLPRLSYVVCAIQLVNMSAIWVGIPDPATLIGNLLLGVWFGATSFGLGRVAARAETRTMQPAPA